jgi:hypothetical protein
MALTQVKSDGIATGAVTATQIATGAVTANDLEDSGVTAGTYGSSSAIPAITVDAKGRVTSASTNSVTQVGGANGVDFNDNVRARFGNGNDLDLSHDGTNSYISNNTGHLYITNAADDQDIIFRTDNGAGSVTNYIVCDGSDGDVQLHHYGDQKLATTSGGINVTGTVTCDGLVCEGEATVTASSGILNIKDSDSSGNATHNFIRGQNTNGAARWAIGQLSTGNEALYVQNNANQNIVFVTNGANRVLIQSDGHLSPHDNNTYDLGTSSNRWRNVYTNDLNLSNEGSVNDVDGTWGNYTIQEGEEDLFLINRRNGKKYKFNLTEVD